MPHASLLQSRPISPHLNKAALVELSRLRPLSELRLRCHRIPYLSLIRFSLTHYSGFSHTLENHNSNRVSVVSRPYFLSAGVMDFQGMGEIRVLCQSSLTLAGTKHFPGPLSPRLATDAPLSMEQPPTCLLAGAEPEWKVRVPAKNNPP